MKKIILWVSWALLVATSVFYTVEGITNWFPGTKALFNITDIQWLAFALCLGQYTSIHVGFTLISHIGKLVKTVGLTSLLIGLLLTIFNISAAYTAISQRHFNVDVEVIHNESKLNRKQEELNTLEKKRKELLDIVKNTPRNHSSNSLKLLNIILPKIDKYQEKIDNLSKEIESTSSDQVLLKKESTGTSHLKNLIGFDPKTFLAIGLSSSLDLLSISLLLSLTAYGTRSTKIKNKILFSPHIEDRKFNRLDEISNSINDKTINEVDIESMYREDSFPISVKDLPLPK